MFRDLTMSKAQRSSHALHTAARLAEHRKKWYSAAELYEAAASLWPGKGISLMRRAEQCRSLVVDACDEMDIED
ncbi:MULTISPECIES: hypothetical protein [Pseudomonas]|jgi:hypothetical protein|uniref:hypothetical protein n=1 Tax=Pseudomonas TaxID=286 RepID=UPI0006427477|nr:MULTISPECIES: hypothetical protein [Pseudomonas]EKT4558755.1 hypothetical protein [Pseudomonas putida]BDD36625.1 hypothetical protein [uncultured bacterium]EIU5536913.1 hypothetical protein [Pseudomonas aeruginosa]KMN22844.1 hypothetical protein TU85_12120 [Pseudomonas helleri]MBA6113914.1 hypothetical protein [Pseudomonas asiatica]